MRLLLLVVCLLAGLAGAEELATFRLASVLPITGRHIEEGLAMRDGYTFGVNKLGVKPLTLEHAGEEVYTLDFSLAIRDSKADPALHMEKLVEVMPGNDTTSGAQFALGSHPEFGRNESEHANELKRIVYHCCIGPDKLYDPSLPYAFGVQISNRQYPNLLIKSAANQGYNSATIVYETTNDFTVTTCESAREQAEANGLEVRLQHSFGYNFRSDDIEAVVEAVVDSVAEVDTADLIIACVGSDVSIQLTKSLRERDVHHTMEWMTAGPVLDSFVDAVTPEMAEYVMSGGQWHSALNTADEYFGANSDYTAEYREQFGKTPSYVAAGASAAVYSLAVALKDAFRGCDISGAVQGGQLDTDVLLFTEGVAVCGDEADSPDPLLRRGMDRVMETLAAQKLVTFFGEIGFNDSHRNVRKEAVTTQIQQSEVECVLPIKYSSASLIYIPDIASSSFNWMIPLVTVLLLGLLAACGLVAWCVVRPRPNTVPVRVASTLATSFLGNVQKGQLIGFGSFGWVYRGTLNGSPVAIKIVLTSSLAEHQDVVREVHMSKQLHHPHVVHSYQCVSRPHTPGAPSVMGVGGTANNSGRLLHNSRSGRADRSSSGRGGTGLGTPGKPPSRGSSRRLEPGAGRGLAVEVVEEGLEAMPPSDFSQFSPAAIEPGAGGPTPGLAPWQLEEGGQLPAEGSPVFPLNSRAASVAGSAVSAEAGMVLRKPSGVDLEARPTPLSETSTVTACPTGRHMMETWIVLELCDGGNLQTAAQVDKIFFETFDPPTVKMRHVLLSLKEVASAMAYLHDEKIIHGDLKLDNVLLKPQANDSRSFECKLSDFGLSRKMKNNATCETVSTTGTLTHAAPELLAGGRLSTRSDVYAFGIMMWELVTGEPLFHDIHPGEMVRQVTQCNERPVFPSHVPEHYVTLATACWDANPRDRPSIHYLNDELQHMLDDLQDDPPTDGMHGLVNAYDSDFLMLPDAKRRVKAPSEHASTSTAIHTRADNETFSTERDPSLEQEEAASDPVEAGSSPGSGGRDDLDFINPPEALGGSGALHPPSRNPPEGP